MKKLLLVILATVIWYTKTGTIIKQYDNVRIMSVHDTDITFKKDGIAYYISGGLIEIVNLGG